MRQGVGLVQQLLELHTGGLVTTVLWHFDSTCKCCLFVLNNI